MQPYKACDRGGPTHQPPIRVPHVGFHICSQTAIEKKGPMPSQTLQGISLAKNGIKKKTAQLITPIYFSKVDSATVKHPSLILVKHPPYLSKVMQELEMQDTSE